MKKQHEKSLTDLQRLLSKQEFNSKEEMEAFIQNIVGQPIPPFAKDAMNDMEKAQDLVFEAHEADPLKAKKLIEEALNLDPDCIEAYEFLGGMENSPAVALAFCEKGVSIGRELFFGDDQSHLMGHFWGFHETRPFMRCLWHSAECYYYTGRIHRSVEILEEMIELNPNDNQGVRDHLLLRLIVLHENEKFIKYEKMFSDDDMTFAMFNRALFAFITDGNSINANHKLKKAMQQNKHVVPLLLQKSQIKNFPDHHGIGDKDEATYFAFHAKPLWEVVPGVMEWVKGIGK